jgi:hypothetical protein
MGIKRIASLLSLMSLIFISVKTKAQSEKIFDKLNTLYTLDKFEECIKRANEYVQSSKTQKDAYPYLYLSMCYFSIYQNLDHYDAKSYKDPLRKALNDAAKYRKHDKQEELKGESSDFLGQLRRATFKECAYMKKNSDSKGLQNLAVEMVKDYPKDYTAQLIAGTYLLYANYKSEGQKAIDGALDSLKETTPVTDSIFQIDYVNAFSLYANYLIETKDNSKAKTVIAEGMDICPGNEDLSNLTAKLN